MSHNYMHVLSEKFPSIQASIVGDPSVYENIVVEQGPPLPAKEILDTAALDIARTEVWKEIQASRDGRRISGVFVQGNWYHSDDPSRIQQIALVMMGANMPTNIMWKTMQGTFVQMTPSLAGAIFQSIIGQDTKIFAQAEYHRQTMISTGVWPHDYDFSAGWPQTYEEWKVAPPPVASFTADVTSGAFPLVVTFTDTSTNSPTGWTWDFGDGTTGSGKTVTHTYADPGTYTVTHTAFNASAAKLGSITMTNLIIVT